MFSLLIAIIYLVFVSLGLPDAVLGSAWPVMHEFLGVPVDFMSYIQVIIAAGTITSSLNSARLIKRFGTPILTTASVALTAVALMGFSFSNEYWMLILWAIPYGIGAGAVDAALNNYVAVNFASRHMNWLHSMWGIGAALGPVIMSRALAGELGWSGGYRVLSIIQTIITIIILLSLPLWKQRSVDNKKNGLANTDEKDIEVLSLKEMFKIPGAVALLIAFYFYTGIENTVGIWASTYFVNSRGIDEVTASSWASLFYIGLTLGRILSGFLTYKFKDKDLIRLGTMVSLTGLALVFVPSNLVLSVAFALIGLGSAPIYPSIIQLVPQMFGSKNSQSVIGFAMSASNLGTLTLPPLFGILSRFTSISLLPIYSIVAFVILRLMFEYSLKSVNKT